MKIDIPKMTTLPDLYFNRGVSKLQIENCDVTSRWAGIRFGPFSDGDFSDIEVL